MGIFWSRPNGDQNPDSSNDQQLKTTRREDKMKEKEAIGEERERQERGRVEVEGSDRKGLVLQASFGGKRR